MSKQKSTKKWLGVGLAYPDPDGPITAHISPGSITPETFRSRLLHRCCCCCSEGKEEASSGGAIIA